MYDRPDLYAAAFSFRSIGTEVDFLLQAYKQHTTGGGDKPSTVLELGCGPAAHSIELARRGARVCAIDLNKSMLDYAATQAAAAGVHATFMQADMTSFKLKDSWPSLDMAVCLLGTFSHLLDNDAARACLRQVHSHLRPGGLLVLELAHPGDLFDGTLLVGDGGQDAWEASYGGRKLLVEWGCGMDEFNPVTQVLQRVVTFSISGGATPSDAAAAEGTSDESDESEVYEDIVPYRQYTVQELYLLADMTGFKVTGLYGDLNLGIDLANDDAFRLVCCLTRV